MSVKKPRDSKVRAVFGNAAPSQEHYNGIKFLAPSADSNPLIANKDFFAFPWKSKGSVCVVSLKTAGAVPDDAPMLDHEEDVVEINFNPFNDHSIAVATEQSVSLWNFSEEGVTSGLKPTHVIENAHGKRMVGASWHPLAQNVLVTTAMDKMVKLWDVENGATEKITLSTVHDGAITSVCWNENGSTLATTARDKYLRVFDPRSNSLISSTICHEGAKGCRAAWLSNKDKIVTVGFMKGVPEREMALFDPRNLSQRLAAVKIDALPSSLFPMYDPDLSLLYLAGKGDGNIRIFEVGEGDLPFQESGEFRTGVAQAGFAMLPKLSNDVMKCEVAKILKLQGTSIVPIRFNITRQNAGYLFQPDLYPDTWDCKPAYSSQSWFSGDLKSPTLVPVTPPS